MTRSAFMEIFGKEASKWLNLLTGSQYDCIVAIARKCPRLIDVIRREEGIDTSSIWDKVITEHALPFHFAQAQEKRNYLLIDDSVFYGSTFKKIETLIRNLNNVSQRANVNDRDEINIKNAALFLLEDNRLTDLSISTHFLTGKEQDAITFVNYEMSAFLQGGPYDLEFPIIYHSGEFDKDKIQYALEKKFPEAQIYSLDEPILLENGEKATRKSWTILFYPINKRNAQSTDPEFSKIRIFLNETQKELRIVPFSPYPLTADVLKKFDLFLPNQYKNLYKKVYNRVSHFLELEANNEDEEYIVYQTERSLVIWINYLLSMNLYIKNKDSLEDVLTSANATRQYSNPKFELKDIRFLIGNELAKDLYPYLETWINSGETMTPLFIDYSPIYVNGLEEMVIPFNYANSFSKALSEKLASSADINEFVSWHFFCQHELIDNASRNQTESNNYARLRYGITYRGLYNNILVHKTDIDFEEELHMVMDAQIDEGSVVPKYIKLSSPGRKSIWTRMFRSGERIPKFIEMTNLALSLIVQLKKKLSVSSIPKTILETYLMQALTNPLDNKELYGLSDYSFKRQLMSVKDGLPMYCAAMVLNQKQNEGFPITRWLINHDFIQESYDSYEISGCVTDHIYFPYDSERAYDEMSSAFAGILDTFYDMKNYIFKLSLFGLSSEETKRIQIELLKLWKSQFEKYIEDLHNTSNDHSSSECYKFLYEYIRNYRDLDNNLLTKIKKIVEEAGNEKNKYWAAILQKEQEGKAFTFDKELDVKSQLAILLCAAYSTSRSEIPMLKNSDIIQTLLEDNNIKRLYDFVLKEEKIRNDILQQICKNIFEKSFHFY